MMQKNNYPFYFLATSLVVLLLGISFGLLAGIQYIIPDFIKEYISFNAVRPLHTLCVVSWIILAALGGIYYYLSNNSKISFFSLKLIKWHFWLFLITGFAIFISYLLGNFQGKEYLEFPTFFYFPIIIGWILFGVNYYKTVVPIFNNWPVYYWMWATGIVFMIFHLTEAHLWILPSFRDSFIQNITIQWKSGGSYVGAWNMLVYGTAIYVMSKISDDISYATSKKAFFFYFLGLTNLMFGWAHHIYIIPTAPWIRYFAYGVSMTEWIILFSIIYDWRKNLSVKKKEINCISYKLMLLADFWVFLNIILALLISIPIINIFTHGTHVTVAHSMGTTIGINTFILLSSIAYIINSRVPFTIAIIHKINKGIQVFNISFFLFWVCLLLMGIKKGYWMFFNQNISFSSFQESQHWLHILFFLFGVGIFIGLLKITLVFLNAIKRMLI